LRIFTSPYLVEIAIWTSFQWKWLLPAYQLRNCGIGASAELLDL
jgi:hypothetical protein